MSFSAPRSPSRAARTTVFDSGLRRSSGSAAYTESHFAFLNRAAGPAWQRVRDLLEAWYADHPDSDGGLRARFREPDIHQHAGAWWELYTFTLFRCLGYTVAVDPQIPGGSGRPDLRVARGDTAMYVECVVLFEDGSRQSTDSEAWIKDCIDAARNPDFLVSVRFERFGSLRPKKRQVTREIEDWLQSLDYDGVRQVASNISGRRLPSRSFDFADSRVSLTALPVSPDARGDDMGRIGVGPGSGAFAVASVDEIRDIVAGKARQCRGADLPLVVAILNWTTFATDREVEQALYGSEALRHEGRTASMIRSTDGYWHPGPPSRGRSVSAAMFGDSIHVSRVGNELPSLWRNPWATMPIGDELPLVTFTARDTGEVVRTSDSAVSPATLFGLASDWPGF